MSPLRNEVGNADVQVGGEVNAEANDEAAGEAGDKTGGTC